ncbi:MAG: DNA polymerase III subunit beta [Candidatus Levybacteria bacterium]|nr:DNA polymerase III subunit beta [Candidatus Levybacteria bacterium]
MKAYLLTDNLQKKLPLVTRAVSTHSQLPILLNILLEAKNGKLILSATDLEIGIQVEIPANIEEEGAVAIPAKTFSELISSLPQEKITIKTEDNNFIVKTSKTKSVFQTLPKEEFPKLYEQKGEEIIKIKKETAQKDLQKVIFSASTDLGRPALSGVLVKIEEEGFLTVGTDGYRLSLKRHNLLSGKKQEGEILKTLLIPARVLREAVSIKDQEGDISVFVSSENNQVLFEQDAIIIVSRLIDAEFPSYEKIIPTDFSTRCSFDKQEMQKAVKICAIFAREAANIIKLSIEKDKVVVSANTPSVGENIVNIEAKTTGEDNEIAFNARYLLDMFTNLDDEEVVFEMAGPLNPGVFKIKNDPSFLHLVCCKLKTKAFFYCLSSGSKIWFNNKIIFCKVFPGSYWYELNFG